MNISAKKKTTNFAERWFLLFTYTVGGGGEGEGRRI